MTLKWASCRFGLGCGSSHNFGASVTRQLAIGAGFFAVLQFAPGSAQAGAIKLAPHQAVYEITLERGGSAISRLTGRMVYEVTGSACEGYEQNMRYVTRSVSSEGVTTLSDMRAASFEGAKGKTFKFSSSQYQDEKLLEQTIGGAFRNLKTGKINVKLKQPKQSKLQIPSKAYFPIQHSIALLEAAGQGKSVLSVDIYDGTDKGNKVYATTSVIGTLLSPAADGKLPKVKAAENLGKLRAWPISISYFEKNTGQTDEVPVYELAFRFYENGVSRKLYIDYGSFAVRGVLSKLRYYKTSKCGARK